MDRPKKRGAYIKGATPIADDLRNRLLDFLNKNNITITSIAESIAVNRTSISGFIHHRHIPSFEIGSRIDNYLKDMGRKKPRTIQDNIDSGVYDGWSRKK